MRIGILGTGMVGQALAMKLTETGHEVVMGTRDPKTTLSRVEPDMYGNPSFSEWKKGNPAIGVSTFSDTAHNAELIINATAGMQSLEVLRAAGLENLANKVLIDIANPLDFSGGMPPSLGIVNKDSLGEQIQAAFPKTKVVKTLNTMGSAVMVNPGSVAQGNHDVFMCGNDAQAKKAVSEILIRDFGWKDVIDMGDITNARGTEMLLPIWVRLYGKLQTPLFNFKIAR